MSIYSSVNQDILKTLAQKNKNNPMLLSTNMFVTERNTLLTFPFFNFFFFFNRFAGFFRPCVNYK